MDNHFWGKEYHFCKEILLYEQELENMEQYELVYRTTGNFAKQYKASIEIVNTRREILESLYQEYHKAPKKVEEIIIDYKEMVENLKANTAQVEYPDEKSHNRN